MKKIRLPEANFLGCLVEPTLEATLGREHSLNDLLLLFLNRRWLFLTLLAALLDDDDRFDVLLPMSYTIECFLDLVDLELGLEQDSWHLWLQTKVHRDSQEVIRVAKEERMATLLLRFV